MHIKIDKPATDNSITNSGELILNPKASPLTAKMADTDQIWHCSDSVSNLIGGKKLPDISYDALPKDQQFNIEMAVAAGNIYRLLLGEPQPKFYSGIDKNNKCYRLSQKISNYADWGECIEKVEDEDKEDKDEPQYTLLENTLIRGTNIVETPDGQISIEIKKIVSTAIVSFFLSDVDTNPGNFGLVKHENNYHMIKIDPECCFNRLFFTQENEDIYKGLNDIVKYHSQDFFANFTDNFANEDGQADMELLNGFMYTEEANLEKFETLYRIIKQPIQAYEAILESCIDKKYHKEIAIIVEGLKKRQQLFSENALRLEGFKEYCERKQFKSVTSNSEKEVELPYHQKQDTSEIFKYFKSQSKQIIQEIRSTIDSSDQLEETTGTLNTTNQPPKNKRKRGSDTVDDDPQNNSGSNMGMN